LGGAIVNSLSQAICIATTAHVGQFDKGGNPYILHPLRIMLKMDSNEERIVAVLHDVIEDTNVLISELRTVFSEEIVNAILALTRNLNESYMDFIRRCKENELARRVKMADIEDNMDLSRIQNPSEEDFKRVQKYEKALKELN
jgi:(p)ppGpp synthase/HD superfamily hydrolase